MTSDNAFRLAAGGRIDRDHTLTFTFNGRRLTGYQGDTLASALLANGVRLVNRSFKFHRPRGIFSAGAEEPNALLAVASGNGLIPMERATLVPLVDGLEARSQTGTPGIDFDLFRILDYTRALWPAGFYNKTFKWPSWHSYEWAMRRMAGLGRLPQGENPARYDHVNTHCDVLVVGTGPAGLEAARQAARDGDDVLLIDLQFEPGGSLLYDPRNIDGRDPVAWLEEALAELRQSGRVRMQLAATAAGFYDHGLVSVHDRSEAWRRGRPLERFWKVRAERVVLATGAIEQPLMFGKNDLPGIMQAEAVLHYAARYAVRCARQLVGLVNNDSGWASLLGIHDLGVPLQRIVDTREEVRADLVEAAGSRQVPVTTGATPLCARGERTVRALEFLDGGGERQRIACDGIAVSGGYNPTLHLYSQAGGRLRYDEDLACFLPAGCAQAVEVVGAAAGGFARAGRYHIAPRRPAPVSTRAQWVDYLHDVSVSDIELAVRENFTSVEHMKRYTTAGMAADQGKTGNLNALSTLALRTDRSPGDVGTTTFRPNFMPVTLGAIAGRRHGRLYAPERRLPAHDWHAARGAVFQDFGGWKRPAWYGTNGAAAIRNEVTMVREAVGLFDASPLGKIEVTGPDAAEFLDRVYLNDVPGLAPGKVRYGLMLTENGIILDDGVFVRLADDHFLLNTTAGSAGRIASWLEEWLQCEWRHLEVVVMPVTSQWGVATMAGARARAVLQQLPGMPDLSPEAFPHMSYAGGRLADGTPFRIQRVSFTGEQSFELSLPADRMEAYLERIMSLGEAHGIGLFGIEALLVLRMEKGFMHVGVDTDGTTNPFDVGYGSIVKNQRTGFIGARSLERAHDLDPNRRQLVGFEVEPGCELLPAGAHFISGNGAGRRSEGYVTSACHSPTLGKAIGLGLLERGRERLGESVTLFDQGRQSRARIVSPCVYDPEGVRMRG